MSNMDATRVMGAPMAGASATIQMPAGGDAFRTQMGGTTTCPVCKSTTPLLDIYCGDCGFLLSSPPVEDVSLPEEESPPAELVDEQTSRRYRLRFGINTIGRQGTDILATEATVSRNHATINVSESGFMVEDLGSSNGTKVGDIPLQPNSPVAAKPGDTIRIGTWKLVLQAGSVNAPLAAEQTILADTLSEDKTAVLSKAQAPPVAAADEANSELTGAVQQAPAIALLTKLEGICHDIRIPDGMISLGRRTGNAVVLADPYLSGRHAEIFAEPSGVYLIDVGSTNGTLVNGQKLEPNDRQLLLDGDEVQLGQTKYRFTSVTEPAADPNMQESGDAAHVAFLDEQNDDVNQADVDMESTESGQE